MPFLAALLPAVIGGVASIGAAAIGASSANKQAKAAAARDAQVRADFAPYRESGKNYLSSLDTAYGLGDPRTLAARRAAFQSNFENSPLYRNVYMPAVENAVNSYDRFASANGQLNSGGTIKAIQDRAAKIAGSTFGDYISGITQRADQGQAAAAQTVSGTQPAFDSRQAATGAAGDAMSAGVLGAGKAITGGINNYNYLNTLSSYGSPAPAYGSPGSWSQDNWAT